MSRAVYCGCHETYPQLREGYISHAPDCPLRTAIAARDQQLAELRRLLDTSIQSFDDLGETLEQTRTDYEKQIAALGAELAKETTVAQFLGSVVDEYRREPDRAAIEAEVVEQVAAWLEGCGKHLLRMAADDVRAGEWRRKP